MCDIQRVNGLDTKYLSAFERGMVVGARCTGLNVSRTATLLGFLCSTVSRVYQEWSTASRVPQRSMRCHYRLGAIPDCVTTGCDRESHRSVHSVVLVMGGFGQVL